MALGRACPVAFARGAVKFPIDGAAVAPQSQCNLRDIQAFLKHSFNLVPFFLAELAVAHD